MLEVVLHRIKYVLQAPVLWIYFSRCVFTLGLHMVLGSVPAHTKEQRGVDPEAVIWSTHDEMGSCQLVLM